MRGGLLDVPEKPEPFLKIHRPAVIRVHQAEFPELGPLVQVRDPRRGDLQENLGKGVQGPAVGQISLHGLEILQKLLIVLLIQDRLHKRGQGVFMLQVRLDPPGIDFAFPGRLDDISLDPLLEVRQSAFRKAARRRSGSGRGNTPGSGPVPRCRPPTASWSDGRRSTVSGRPPRPRAFQTGPLCGCARPRPAWCRGWTWYLSRAG